MGQAYRIDRINLITYPGKRKKILQSCRCRYLAKSHIVNCSAKGQTFDFVNFRGSIITKVNFEKATIKGCDFWGVTFNECDFTEANISDCVFMACKFRNCTFSNTHFNYTTIVNTALNECKNIDISFGVKILTEYPKCTLTDELTDALTVVKNDRNLKKCKLLFISDTKYNELNLFLLLRRFTARELADLLLEVCKYSTSTITTYKKLERQLKKAQECATI